MRKLVESTFLTLDGVIEAPQRWGPPYWDDEHSGYSQKLMSTADALLLGRATYEGFAQAWPARSGDAFTDKINSMPKHVASRTLEDGDMTWNATLLKGDAADAVAKLKAQSGGDLLKYGTGEFDRALLDQKLVDEYHFWMFPVIIGSGEHLLPGIDLTTLKLLGATTFDSGIVVLKYAPK
jgi:dihydrofolate reductase